MESIYFDSCAGAISAFCVKISSQLVLFGEWRKTFKIPNVAFIHFNSIAPAPAPAVVDVLFVMALILFSFWLLVTYISVQYHSPPRRYYRLRRLRKARKLQIG